MMPPKITDRLTLCIKAFERPHCLANMLRSIRAHAPTMPVLIADDSQVPFDGPLDAHTRLLPLPFDVGLSAGRNRLVQTADTELVAILDDDFEMGPEMDLDVWVSELDRGDYDLLGCRLLREDGTHQSYEGWMIEEEGRLYMVRFYGEGTLPFELIANCFIARKDRLATVPWDEELKIIEHEDFFWRAKQAGLKVGYTDQVALHHKRQKSPGYNQYRNARVNHFQRIAQRKRQWQEVGWYRI